MNMEIALKILDIVIVPISIAIAGTIVARKIDSKKSWETKWSESFFGLFQDYNIAVENLVFVLWQLTHRHEQGNLSPEEAKRFADQLRQLNDEITRKEFGMSTQLCFASKTKEEMMNLFAALRKEIEIMVETRKGSVDTFHNILIELNKQARIAHAEILGLQR